MDNKKHIPKSVFISALAKRAGYNREDVANVVDCIDDVLIDMLSEATPEMSAEVSITHNIRIENYYTPPKKKMDPHSHEMWMAPAHFRTRAKFSKTMRALGGD